MRSSADRSGPRSRRWEATTHGKPERSRTYGSKHEALIRGTYSDEFGRRDVAHIDDEKKSLVSGWINPFRPGSRSVRLRQGTVGHCRLAQSCRAIGSAWPCV